MYAAFNGLCYSAGWNDVIIIIRLTLFIAAAFTLITWMKARNS